MGELDLLRDLAVIFAVAVVVACANRLPVAASIPASSATRAMIPPILIAINSTMKFVGRNVTALITGDGFSTPATGTEERR